MTLKMPSLNEFRRDALRIRKRFLRMHFEAYAGHIGTGLSDIDLLTYLYKAHLRSPGTPGGDVFILSKGHGASSLYATLNHFGLLSDENLATYYKEGTLLPAHPAPRAWDTIPAATGSLGHGLSIGAGIAFAHRVLKPSSQRVVCLLSDGDCNEGSVWEAAMFAAHHRLGNLTVVVDANGLQGFGKTTEVLNVEPLPRKWDTFGFDTIEIDGHDFEAIRDALTMTISPDRPRCIVARTIKGKGVSFMENRLEWHYKPMEREHYTQVLAELDEAERNL
ncbi:MAG: transketolase [Oligoflexia bacterium]|nr:transketolase [Oligoflexia bacterium]